MVRNTAELLQFAADRHDMKAFYDGLKAVYGPRDTGSIPVRSKDGKTLITDRAGILSRWAEHFHGVLNQISTFDPTVLSDLPVWDTNHDLMQPPDSSEVMRAINQMSSGKAPGPVNNSVSTVNVMETLSVLYSQSQLCK